MLKEKIHTLKAQESKVIYIVLGCLLSFLVAISIAYLYQKRIFEEFIADTFDANASKTLFFLLMLLFLLINILLLILYKKNQRGRIHLKTEIHNALEGLNEAEEQLKKKNEELERAVIQLEESERRYRVIFEASDEGLWFIDSAKKEMAFSKRWYEIFGIEENKENFSMERCMQRIHPEDLQLFTTMMKDMQAGELDRFSVEIRIMNHEGKYRWISARGLSLHDTTKQIQLMAGAYSDIHEKKVQEQNYVRIVYYDNVTMLPNRVFCYEWLNKRIKLPIGFTVMFIDLDNFKMINDNFGHTLGDLVLNEVAARLNEPNGINKIVSRISGDEFMLILDQVNDTARVQEIGKSVLEVFRKSFRIENNDLHISTSIGIAIYPKDADTVDELLKNADTALSKAKELGKNCMMIFDKTMNEEVKLKVEMGNALRNAIENDELSVYYQPQVNLKTGKIYGLEALVRWNSSKYGFVPPSKFIKMAEELGLIVSIGDWVFKHSCKYAEEINRNRDHKLIVSVNISAIQLMQGDFTEKIEEIIRETNTHSEYVGIELTETALMESFETSAEKLEYLKNKGMEIALDDFGTGYSSLNYLRKLPITKLKIDKTFIDDLLFDEKGANLTESIIQIAHKFDMEVVAEGVEHEEQLAILIESGCDIIQGYLLSRPLPAQQLEDVLDLEYQFEITNPE